MDNAVAVVARRAPVNSEAKAHIIINEFPQSYGEFLMSDLGFSGLAAISLAALLGPSFAHAQNASEMEVMRLVDEEAPKIGSNAMKIWRYAESGYHETRSSSLLQSTLKAAGFSIRTGVSGMPTAFVASYHTDSHPVISILGEFDALPGSSQAAVPVRQAVVGMSAGHACGHNLFGAASVGAAIAVRQWMEQNAVKGEIRFYGTPAEEAGAAKAFMVRDGLFNDVDIVLHWHPADVNSAAQWRSLASVGVRFQFYGTASHAAAAPEMGRSALDGVEVMDVAVNFLREHIPQETRIHYVIRRGGEAPNVVPAFAESEYYIRSPDAKQLQAIVERVKKAAEGAAIATGTRSEAVVDTGVYDLLPNDVLGHLADKDLRIVGGVKYGLLEESFAQAITPTLGKEAYIPGSESRVTDYSSDHLAYASTDVGDVSYVVPTVGVNFAAWVPGTVAHSWQAAASAGTSVGTQAAVRAAKTLAMIAVDVFNDPATITAAKAELVKRRGAGFKYQSLAGDAKPDLRYGEKPIATR